MQRGTWMGHRRAGLSARLARLAIGASALALVASMAAAAPAASPTEADAASCLKISGGVFDSPSNDNYMPYLNQEYVIIKNAC